jgi:Rieske Fe-S protein
VATGAVVRGPATQPLKTYLIEVKNDIGSVAKSG